MASVTTRSFTNYRDGANLFETVFTQASVREKGLTHQFDLLFPDDSRGSEGMTLLVENLTMGDGNIHNVCFTASMGNTVYADDAATGERLWEQKVGNPIPSNAKLDMWFNNSLPYNWGILSTPVIDLVTGLIHVSSWSDPNGNSATAQFYLHSLNLIDGSQAYPPVNLSQASYQPPDGLSTQYIKTVPRKQRCGLALATYGSDRVVFACFGSFDEDADTNQGWIVAINVSAGAAPYYAGAITTSARYSGPGLWMGGQGPSITEDGHLLVMTGNGAFCPPTDLGESFIRYSYTPSATKGKIGLFSTVSWFSPYTDTGRMGADPTIASTDLLPKSQQTDNPVGGTSNMNSPDDEDLGSGGPLYLPASLTGYSKNVIVGAGKDGILYVVDADNMGDTQLADFAPDKIAGNYAKLLSPPYGFTAYLGNTNLAPTQLDQIPTTYDGMTRHQHSTPIYYNSPKYEPMLFTCGENSAVRAFKFNSDFTLTYLGCSTQIASPNLANNPPGGMPGGMMTLSANGSVSETGILWVTLPYGDANKYVGPGRFVAFAADNIVDGIIETLWDSEKWEFGFIFNKFNIPMPSNGRVYVPTYAGMTRVLS